MKRVLICVLALCAVASSSFAQDRRSKEDARASAIEAGIWNGEVTANGRLYALRVINDFEYRGNLQSRFEFRDPSGGAPLAVGYGGLSNQFLSISSWSYVPTGDGAPKLNWNPRVSVSATDPSVLEVEAAPGFGFSAVTLRRASMREALGEVATARDVSGQFEGTLGCHGDRPPARAMRLNMEATSDTRLKGTLETFVLPRGASSQIETMGVLAEFDPARGALTVVVDDGPVGVYDFEGRFSDTGLRLAGLAGRGTNCEVVQFYRPGANPLEAISRPFNQSITEWDAPAACVAMIKWANQALKASGGKSLYSGMTIAAAERIAAGLFADARFRPFFGASFNQIAAEDRSHLATLAEACKRQTAFSRDMLESGAYSAITTYFSVKPRPTSELPVQRFQMLHATLLEEMGVLRPRVVGEADIAELEGLRTGLDTRFGDLWEADKAKARALIEAKLEAARGAMAKRLAADIAALGADVNAFKEAISIRRQIKALGDTGTSAQTDLNAALDGKLSKASDAELAKLATMFAGEPKDLATLKRMRSDLEFRWPTIGAFVKSDGPGTISFSAVFTAVADSAFPAFEKTANEFLDENASYETRQRQYRQIVGLYASIAPTATEWASIVSRYTGLVRSLEPKVEPADLIDADGSPSALGLRMATTSYVEQYWETIFTLFPYDISFVTATVKVVGVTKESCKTADTGGYWCDFHLMMDSAFPFPEILSNIPSSARFTKTNSGWTISEVPNNPGSGVGGAGIPESLLPCDGCYDPWSTEAYVNSFWAAGWLD